MSEEANRRARARRAHAQFVSDNSKTTDLTDKPVQQIFYGHQTEVHETPSPPNYPYQGTAVPAKLVDRKRTGPLR